MGTQVQTSRRRGLLCRQREVEAWRDDGRKEGKPGSQLFSVLRGAERDSFSEMRRALQAELRLLFRPWHLGEQPVRDGSPNPTKLAQFVVVFPPCVLSK